MSDLELSQCSPSRLVLSQHNIFIPQPLKPIKKLPTLLIVSPPGSSEKSSEEESWQK